MDIPTTKVQEHLRRFKPADESKLGFGHYFSNHMFLLDYKEGSGWHNPRIVPYGPLGLEPAAVVLHYAQEVFEGLKAYRWSGGRIALFRARDNLRRMTASCARVCIPPYPEDLVHEGMKKLIALDRDWVPSSPATLYIRPTIIATESFVGVRPSSEYLLFIITGPVGAYYPEGFNPTKIYVEEKYARAAAGGTGGAKTSCNYANSLLAFKEAHDAGYTQVLWLDACDRKTVEEVGTSNMFFVIGDEVITAPLGGTILPGVTRDSALKLCEHWGIKAAERRITIDEVLAAQKDGSLQEAFGAGTAAVISPVGQFAYRGQEYKVGDGKTGPISRRLYDEIVGIQYGDRPDPFNWVVKIA